MDTTSPLTIALTGASGGLGIALVQVLEDELKCKVIPHVRSEEGRLRLERARGKSYPNCFVADFTQEQHLRSDEWHDWLNKCDVLINNAAVYHADYFVETPPETVLAMLRINLEIPLLLTQRSLKNFRERGAGVIINISSGSGSHGGLLPSLSYALSKNGLNQMTAWLARETPEGDVAIVSLAPKFIRTPMLNRYREFWRKLSKDAMPADERDALEVARDVAQFVTISYAREFHGQTIPI